MVKILTYLALIAVPMLVLERVDGIIGAAALVLSFGAAALAAWLVGDRPETTIEKAGGHSG